MDLAPGTDVAALWEPCALCCAMVFTNQPHIRNEKGIFHEACHVDQGRCHVCKRKVFSTELYKMDEGRLYHAKCTAKFKDVCYMCNENVYDIPSQLCQFCSGHGWYHTDCQKNTFDTCCVCGFEVRYKPFGKRLVFRLPNGDLVHTACNVKPIELVPVESTDPQDEPPLNEVQSITQPYNAQAPLAQASSGIMVVWSGPPDKCCKGICPICKVMVYQSQKRFRDPKGRYLHDSCYWQSSMGIKAVIAKKPITSAKLHTKKSSSGVQSGSGDNAH